MAKRACPCCGFLTLGSEGNFEICDVCFWEDDLSQSLDPDSPIGANAVSLREARENFRRTGASEEQFRFNVRHPRPDEKPPN
jgi:hypothetical protein